MRVDDPARIITTSQPTAPTDIDKAPGRQIRQTCNNIPQEDPQMKADNALKSPNNADEPFTKDNANINITSSSQYEEDQ